MKFTIDIMIIAKKTVEGLLKKVKICSLFDKKKNFHHYVRGIKY